MPSPTDILRAEHENILRGAAVAEAMARAVGAGSPPAADDCAALCDFITGYAERWHHGKEEAQLFPAMEQAGMPHDQGPIGVMLHDHTMARAHTAAMLQGVTGLRSGAEGAAERFADGAASWAALLRDHIEKENEVLFHMADDVIPPPAMEELAAEFDRFAAEVGEAAVQRWLALLARLEALVGG